jgi:hypothetical protein
VSAPCNADYNGCKDQRGDDEFNKVQEHITNPSHGGSKAWSEVSNQNAYDQTKQDLRR